MIYLCLVVSSFVFKHITVYELLMSDWSSDVSSSYLLRLDLIGNSGMEHRLPVVMNAYMYGNGNPIYESSADVWALTALHREVDSETERRFDAVGARIAEPFDQRAEEVALIARSEERRVGKGGVSTCRSRWLPKP